MKVRRTSSSGGSMLAGAGRSSSPSAPGGMNFDELPDLVLANIARCMCGTPRRPAPAADKASDSEVMAAASQARKLALVGSSFTRLSGYVYDTLVDPGCMEARDKAFGPDDRQHQQWTNQLSSTTSEPQREQLQQQLAQPPLSQALALRCPVRRCARKIMEERRTAVQRPWWKITATDAMNVYSLTRADLARLDCETRPNPHDETHPPMRLFNRVEIAKVSKARNPHIDEGFWAREAVVKYTEDRERAGEQWRARLQRERERLERLERERQRQRLEQAEKQQQQRERLLQQKQQQQQRRRQQQQEQQRLELLQRQRELERLGAAPAAPAAAAAAQAAAAPNALLGLLRLLVQNMSAADQEALMQILNRAFTQVVAQQALLHQLPAAPHLLSALPSALQLPAAPHLPSAANLPPAPLPFALQLPSAPQLSPALLPLLLQAAVPPQAALPPAMAHLPPQQTFLPLLTSVPTTLLPLSPLSPSTPLRPTAARPPGAPQPATRVRSHTPLSPPASSAPVTHPGSLPATQPLAATPAMPRPGSTQAPMDEDENEEQIFKRVLGL